MKGGYGTTITERSKKARLNARVEENVSLEDNFDDVNGRVFR